MSQTPILDREQPLPAVKKIKKWKPALLGAAIGVAIIVWQAFSDAPPEPPPNQAVLWFLFPAFYFAVLVHELGHLMAGLSAGFALRSLAVGPFLLTREAQGLKLRFTPKRFLVGGLTAMVPNSADRLTERYRRLVLGGPLASIFLLAIAAILLLRFPDSSALRSVLYIDLFLTVVCCLPYTVRSQPTDGKSILLLSQKGPGAERFAAIMYLLALDTQLVEPHAWSPELVEKLSLPSKDKTRLAASVYFRYVVALDSGDAAQIAEALERGLAINHEAWPDIQRVFHIGAACYHGIIRHNSALAQAWLEDARAVKQAVSRKDWDAKAMASVALANGDDAQARELLTRYLAGLDQLPASGMLQAERARTVELLRHSQGAVA